MQDHKSSFPVEIAPRSCRRPFLPLPAIVGNAGAKLALALLAVDRNLKGILITSRAGCGKTSIARAAQALFPRLQQIPTSVTDDQLLGGLDLEKTLRCGAPHHRAGLLARAHQSALWVDDVNLLGARQLYLVAMALEEGIVRLEREGQSRTAAADFVVIGSYNSTEAEVGAILRDRVGLVVEAEELHSDTERIEVLSRALELAENAEEVVARSRQSLADLTQQIAVAKEIVTEIPITSDDARRIAEASLRLGIEGNRADLFALRAARAHAALSRRECLTDDDLTAAIRFVLLPRATRLPEESRGDVEQHDESSAMENASDQYEAHKSQQAEKSRPDVEDREGNRSTGSLSAEDLIIRAMDVPLPQAEMTAAFKGKARRGRMTSGKRQEQARNDHGREVAALADKSAFSRVAIVPTLRAAAPFQGLRRGSEESLSGVAIHITPEDLRYTRRKARSGMLFILAVDTSGSMAVNRLAQAKGAMTRLLREAYICRDKVALISFRRLRADVLLAPTRSLELAKRVVDALPAGGATPIAAALLKSMEVAERATSQGVAQAMIVLFTDGRANVSSAGRGDREEGSAIKAEIERIGAALQAKEIPVLVIDTNPKFIKKNDAGDLADLLGAQYSFLPRANEEAIYRKIKEKAMPL